MPSRTFKRGEQRGRAVALVVVGHRAGAALLHRQAGLGAVERLDLALLVHRQHDRMRRRIDVEADHVLQLVGELRIVGELELAHPVRRQTVAAPDALHRGDADPGGLGHRRRRPVGRLAGRVAGRQLDHARDHRLVQGRLARRPRLVAQQAIDAGLHEPLLPAPDHRLALAGLPHDRGRAQPVGGQQHDPRPPDMLLRAVPIGDDRGQSRAILGPNVNDDPLAHPPDSHTREAAGIPKGTQDCHRCLTQLRDIISLLRPNRLLQHITKVDGAAPLMDGWSIIQVHCCRILSVIVGVAVTSGEMTLQEIRPC